MQSGLQDWGPSKAGLVTAQGIQSVWGGAGHPPPSWPRPHTLPCFTHSEPLSLLLALGTSQEASERSEVLREQSDPERVLICQDHSTHPCMSQILNTLPFGAPAGFTQRAHLVRVTQQAQVTPGLAHFGFWTPTVTLSKSWKCGCPRVSSVQGARRFLPHPLSLPTGGWEWPDCFGNQS